MLDFISAHVMSSSKGVGALSFHVALLIWAPEKHLIGITLHTTWTDPLCWLQFQLLSHNTTSLIVINVYKCSQMSG